MDDAGADSDATAPSLDIEGPAAPPRQNGELVFESPWESRIFGVTIALCDQGRLDWDEFRQQLIEEIGRSDEAAEFDYYRHWQRALETVVDRTGLCRRASLRARAEVLAARPHGHDH